MNLILTSFGYRFGVPVHADIVFDVRFLPNPHYVPSLRELTGREPAVREFVFADRNTELFLDKVKDLMDFLIPLMIREGKSYLNVAIGCTGGRHRSVAIVECLAGHLAQYPVTLDVIHRDI